MTSFHSVASAPSTRATNSATRHSCSVQKHFVAAENPAGAWRSTSRIDEDPPDAVAGLDGGDLLAHERVGRVGSFERQPVQRLVRHQPVDAAALVLELAHRLLERVALDADEVRGRHAHVGEEDLAEVAVRRHVGDRADLDARRVDIGTMISLMPWCGGPSADVRQIR